MSSIFEGISGINFTAVKGGGGTFPAENFPGGTFRGGGTFPRGDFS